MAGVKRNLSLEDAAERLFICPSKPSCAPVAPQANEIRTLSHEAQKFWSRRGRYRRAR